LVVFECHKNNLLVHVNRLFRCSKHHEKRNFSSSQLVIHLEIYIVPSASHDTISQLRVVQSIAFNNRFGELSKMLQMESAINSLITNTSRDPQKSGDTQEKKEFKLCFHQLQIQHKNHQASRSSTLHYTGNKEEACIVTASLLSWIRSSDESKN
jgi:hypothetical protein